MSSIGNVRIREICWKSNSSSLKITRWSSRTFSSTPHAELRRQTLRYRHLLNRGWSVIYYRFSSNNQYQFNTCWIDITLSPWISIWDFFIFLIVKNDHRMLFSNIYQLFCPSMCDNEERTKYIVFKNRTCSYFYFSTTLTQLGITLFWSASGVV